jgi:hypothetical protein
MFLWRQRMWFESTFVLSMLEPWEKVLLRKPNAYPESNAQFTNQPFNPTVVSILAFFCMLVVTGLFKHLPHHLDLMLRRAVYYLWGQEGETRHWFGLGKGAGDGVRDLLQEL